MRSTERHEKGNHLIITLTGAYRNAGDHLIGHRARALLTQYVDKEIVNVDRRHIKDAHYDLFNEAKAVILCGGPAYQKEMFPKVYPIDLERIETRVIPMGLGWKGSLRTSPESFEFSPETQKFITEIHSRIEVSSTRDLVSEHVIRSTGVSNVSMTGCPAWYDLERKDRAYEFVSSPTRIVYSMPAKPQENVLETLNLISKAFPRAEKVLALHHGWKPARSKHGDKMFKWHLKVAALASLRGWRTQAIADGLAKFEELYDWADLHLGYRVHAHIYSISQQSASILINEDSRGVGQVTTLGGPMLSAKSSAQDVMDAINTHFDTRGAAVAGSVEVMQKTFPKMEAFLATI